MGEKPSGKFQVNQKSLSSGKGTPLTSRPFPGRPMARDPAVSIDFGMRQSAGNGAPVGARPPVWARRAKAFPATSSELAPATAPHKSATSAAPTPAARKKMRAGSRRMHTL